MTMKMNIILLPLLLVMMLLTSCDEHRDFPDTAMKVCDIVCTDGEVLPLAQYKESGKEAIAVVYHISHAETEPGHGYAVYLWDIGTAAFADSLGIRQGTSADPSAMDGNANTYALYTCKDTGSPMAKNVFAMWRYGQSAYVPSAAQMRQLKAARAKINPIIAMCGGTPLPEDEAEGWYWTSTEVKGQETAKAWLYSLSSGAMQETPKNQAHRVRPIITIME